MAGTAAYKQRSRRDREARIENDLSQGMMWTNGAIDEGYVKSFVNCSYDKETSAIIPRPGLRVSGCIFPKSNTITDQRFFEDNVVIHATKPCVEDGITYEQTIIGRLDNEDNTKGLIWVLTSRTLTEYTEPIYAPESVGTVSFSDYSMPDEAHVCMFFSADSPKIHDIFLESDTYRRTESPVGCFAYNNSFYFFGEDSHENAGLFRTVFDATLDPPRYVFEKVKPKKPTVSEAVLHGYNVLRGDETYTFSNGHTASVPQFDGILPYEPDTTHSHTKLIMTPKKGQPVDLVCYYDFPDGSTYDIVWEAREATASDWTQHQKTTVTFDANTVLCLDGFLAQDQETMVRVVAYQTGTDEVIKAIVVGFDFRAANYGTANALPQKIYNLHTATGAVAFNDRIAVWGLPADPTILFISDYNEPAYFPYPNNIVVFDEPIVHCVEFMGTLIVFTMDKIYQVTQADDGVTWTSVVIQTHLSIDPWDKHLIKTVRNMLYFKSGNYYYMMVPKARSLTGELTIAPITTPITSFFDRFSVNVQELLKYTYGYTDHYELLTYYNYLDYDEIHNIYAYKFNDSLSVMHFDVIYNTNDRTWKVWIFESANLVFPYRQEATRLGRLATTSLIQYNNISDATDSGQARIIQLYTWDNLLVRSCYIPHGSELAFNPDAATVTLNSGVLVASPEYAEIDGHTLRFTNPELVFIDGHTLRIQDASDFHVGYSKRNIIEGIRDVYHNQEQYYTFRNYQFIDTGYRNDNLHAKKRYRELQLQINNLDKKNMDFGMDYILDGSPRRVLYKYDVSQSIDEMDPDYGVLYVDSTPYFETKLDDIDMSNQWTIDQGLTPEVSLWKIRVALSGKGYAPRLRLYSQNEKRFELLSVNWVARLMHMR